MDYIPKYIPEGINNPKESFVKQFFQFVIGAAIFVVLVFLFLNIFVDLFVKWMPDSMDKSMRSKFRNLENFAIDSMKPIDSKYLDDLVMKMDPELVKRLNIHTHVICGSQVNAFATIGGEIYVMNGFLQNLESENELVMVLGHELGHFAHRHHWRSMGNGAIYFMLHSLLDVAGIGALTTVTPDIVFGKFTQKHELEADRYGMDILNNQFQHVGGYDTFFNKILTIPLDDKGTHHPGRLESWFSSHPYPKDRNEILKEYATSKAMLMKDTAPVPAELKTLCKPTS